MTQIAADGEGIGENSGRDPQTYAIIGAAMEVHRQLGHGFLESVYQEGLAFELVDRGVPFRREQDLPIHYKGRLLACGYRADFICFETIIVELKAIGSLSSKEQAQVINYLKATGYSRGLLLNFGGPRLETKRFVRSLFSA
jgi:GxxExxY protein